MTGARLLPIIAVVLLSQAATGPAVAQVADAEFKAACLRILRLNDKACTCFSEKLSASGGGLTGRQQTYVIASLTQDEARLKQVMNGLSGEQTGLADKALEAAKSACSGQ